MANFTHLKNFEKTSGLRWLREKDRLPVDRFKEAIANASTEESLVTLCKGLLSAVKNGDKIDCHEQALSSVRNFIITNVKRGDYITVTGLFKALPRRSKDFYCACIACISDMKEAGQLKPIRIVENGYYHNVYEVI